MELAVCIAAVVGLVAALVIMLLVAIHTDGLDR